MRSTLNPTSLTPEDREERRQSFAGGGAVHHDPGTNDGSSYYTSEHGTSFYLMAFRGRALRPAMNYRFRSAAARDGHIAGFVENLRERATHEKRERTPHTLTTGQILYTSWGYDQTNVEFYEVVAVRGAVVDIRRLGEESKQNEPTSMQGSKLAVAGQYVGEVIKGKRPTGRNTIRICSVVTAFPWDGRPMSWSSYA